MRNPKKIVVFKIAAPRLTFKFVLSEPSGLADKLSMINFILYFRNILLHEKYIMRNIFHMEINVPLWQAELA